MDTYSASVLGAVGRILHIFYGEMDSDLEVFSLRSHAERRSVLSRCFSELALGNYFFEVHEAGSGEMAQIFGCFLRASRGWDA